ncbi:MAG: SDR family NAD(P)-dependent oxidoreductase [Bacteroidetes bacterium]|nr:SDR family NAD(P)-dependent oxidoreductase [Bacteroidota bacterium]
MTGTQQKGNHRPHPTEMNDLTERLPEEKSNRRALVTGGTGFIGSHLVRRLLDAGYTVRVMARHPDRNNEHRQLSAQQIETVEWIGASLADHDQIAACLKDVDVVFHCAARISFHALDRETLYKTNVAGTARLVDACLEAGVKRLIHLSSVAALGRSSREDGMVDEFAEWDEKNSPTIYARSKFLAELEVWRGQEEGLEVAMAHPSIVIGPGKIDHRGSNRFYQMGRQGMPIYPTGSVGFVDVRDVAEVLYRLDSDALMGQKFVLNSVNLSYRSFFQEMADRTGSRPPRYPLPYLPAMVMASALEWLSRLLHKRFPLTRETIRAACSHTQYDGRAVLKAIPDFQYRDFFDTLNDGLDFNKKELDQSGFQ